MKRMNSSGRHSEVGQAGSLTHRAAPFLIVLWLVTAAAHRVLVIEPSSMPVAAGTATLTIGSLQRTGDMYGGTYQMKVSPYFFKSEKGRLAIVVPAEALAKISQGQVATVIGTATTSGAAGQARHVDAIATPTSKRQGRLKLWFMAGDRKMIFEPAYHFAEQDTAALPGPTTGDQLVSDRGLARHRITR